MSAYLEGKGHMHMGPILLFSMGMAGLLVVSTKPVAQRARVNSITLIISTRKVSHDSMTSLYRGRIFYNGPLTRDWTLVFGHCLIWRSNGGEGGRQGGGDERERDVQHSDRERERGR